MVPRVVVLGAGYAGSVAVQTLARRLDDPNLTWIADVDYHLVLHEVHRAIRDPGVAETITIPVDAIRAGPTRFIEGEVVGLDVNDRRVKLADRAPVDYDYLLVCLGSETAFYGIPGLRERSHTLAGLDDALAINEAVTDAAASATPATPAEIVVGGAGLSGVQAAGEMVALRDEHDLSLTVTVVEALDTVLPGSNPTLQNRVDELLTQCDVRVLTADPVVEAETDVLHFEERESMPYDVLVWTGGVTGRSAMTEVGVSTDHGRLETDRTFRTSEERVFAVGDAALVDLDGGAAPPTAQAAWDGGKVAAGNLVRSIRGEPLDQWNYRDKGTLVSVGDQALAHDVAGVPITTFGGPPAVFLKKLVAARWIATLTSWRRGLSAWDVL